MAFFRSPTTNRREMPEDSVIILTKIVSPILSSNLSYLQGNKNVFLRLEFIQTDTFNERKTFLRHLMISLVDSISDNEPKLWIDEDFSWNGYTGRRWYTASVQRWTTIAGIERVKAPLESTVEGRETVWKKKKKKKREKKKKFGVDRSADRKLLETRLIFPCSARCRADGNS